MKKLALGALLIGLLVACGSDPKPQIKLDGGTVDGLTACNPRTQTGCNTGEKCTWIVDLDEPGGQYVGHIGCVPAGDKAIGAACSFGAPGATGYDDCVTGAVCSNFYPGSSTNPGGVCKQVCDHQGGSPMCDNDHVCVRYSKLFQEGAAPTAAGVCDRACDPFTDNDFDGSGAASNRTTQICGADPKVGCYGFPSDSPPRTGWSCTRDINYDSPDQPLGKRHRVALGANDQFLNSCNQGYLPLLYEAPGSTTVVCIAMCKPANCYSDNGVSNCGTGNENRYGLAGSGHTCQIADRPGNFDGGSTGQNGEHCWYSWYFEVDFNTGQLLESPTSDTLGFCYDHSKYPYTVDNEQYLRPACATQPITATGTDPKVPSTYWGAVDMGCVDTDLAGFMAQGKGRMLPSSTLEKLRKLDLPRPLYDRELAAE
jgi:hypothetical protein